MKRIGNEQSLGSVINELLKVYRLDHKMQELDVVDAWKEVMGPVVARKTTDVKLRGANLIVALNSGPLKEEFSMNKARIVELMNEKLGATVISEVQIF